MKVFVLGVLMNSNPSPSGLSMFGMAVYSISDGDVHNTDGDDATMMI